VSGIYFQLVDDEGELITRCGGRVRQQLRLIPNADVRFLQRYLFNVELLVKEQFEQVESPDLNLMNRDKLRINTGSIMRIFADHQFIDYDEVFTPLHVNGIVTNIEWRIVKGIQFFVKRILQPVKDIRADQHYG
jgi:hypothetical protein